MIICIVSFYQLSPQNMGLFEYGINRHFSILNLLLLLSCTYRYDDGMVLRHDAGVGCGMTLAWPCGKMLAWHRSMSGWACGGQRLTVDSVEAWLSRWHGRLLYAMSHHFRPCSKVLKSLLFCCRCVYMHCCGLNMIWNSWQVLFPVEQCWKLLTLWRYLVVI